MRRRRKFKSAVSATMTRELARLHAGETTFEQFAAATRRDYERMAAALMQRWETPDAVEVDDVVQEMMLETWRLLPKWKPWLRDLADYISWNANAAGKKWIHAQRDAYRRDDKSPPRYVISESRWNSAKGARAKNGAGVYGDGGRNSYKNASVFDRVAVSPSQEAVVAGRELYARVIAGMPEGVHRELFERTIAAGGNYDLTAARVYEQDPRLSLRIRAGSKGDVERMIERSFERAATVACDDA